ncbi:MAG: class I SAM-dependent methyltransferase [Bacteroidetes bacterium]|nr:class I SAM-dependent methyltransferase [Bacteroidota bacterium]
MKKTLYLLLISILSLQASASLHYPQTDSLKASKKWGKWLTQFDLRAHDTIISLGCGNGWREFELSLLTNDLNFYLEDLDSLSLNQRNITRAKTEFAGERKSPLTNTFRAVYGTSQTIPLRDAFADKVMIMNAYHHFDNKDIMLKEIYRVLLPHGKLIITDHVSLTESKESSYGCDRTYFLLNEKDLVDQIEKAGLKLLSVSRMEKRTRVFVFEKQGP